MTARDKRVESMQIGVDVVDTLRSEVERLRALLRECEPHINEHYDDGADLCKRIRAALGEGK